MIDQQVIGNDLVLTPTNTCFDIIHSMRNELCVLYNAPEILNSQRDQLKTHLNSLTILVQDLWVECLRCSNDNSHVKS